MWAARAILLFSMAVKGIVDAAAMSLPSLFANHQEEADTPVLGGIRAARCARIAYPLKVHGILAAS